MSELTDTSRQYLAKPEECLSTHGGAGWPESSFQREDGMVVCGDCGMVCEPNYVPSWVAKGISFEQDEHERRQDYLNRKPLIDRILGFLFGVGL